MLSRLEYQFVVCVRWECAGPPSCTLLFLYVAKELLLLLEKARAGVSDLPVLSTSQ